MFDRDDVTKSSVTVAIDAASIDTALDARNADLNIPDFLNTAEFPTITIVSTSVEKTGEMTGKVTGGATMLGVTLPVTLDMNRRFLGMPRSSEPAFRQPAASALPVSA